MFTKIRSMCLNGIKGEFVDVEIDVGKGIPDFNIVGLGDMAVHESKKRVRAAIANSNLKFPMNRITVNLAPANMKKEGTCFDLAIAVGILICTGVLPKSLAENYTMIGELSLDGNLRKVDGMLPMLLDGMNMGETCFIIPNDNEEEASMTKAYNIYCFRSLTELKNMFVDNHGDYPYSNYRAYPNTRDDNEYIRERKSEKEDMKDIVGQKRAKRVMEIAASGGHNLILKGSPGCGKTMLARRMKGILPPMRYKEAIEVTSLYSAAGLLSENEKMIKSRPFRQLTMNCGPKALTGGERSNKIGEVSLAHNGVLFIDEFAEMKREVLDAIRLPLEERTVTQTIDGKQYILPANFQLVATANPCRCGYLYEEGRCKCTPTQVRNYERKIAGPLADRIDIHLEVFSVPNEEIDDEEQETSETIRKRVAAVRKIQEERYKDLGIKTNAELTGEQIKKYCKIDKATKELLASIMDKNGFSMRSYEKILKIARTIADMDGRKDISENDVAEAVQYRPKFAVEGY